MERKRQRNTTRVREAGAASRAQTRHLLLTAAAEEFARVGYVASTVSRIAEGAGVTVQTLYLAWGSKRALLRGYLESTLAPDAAPSGQHFAAQLQPDSPAGTLAQVSALVCDAARRSAIAWRAYRDGSGVDSAIAAEWHQIQMLRRETMRALLVTIPDDALRLPRQDAVDTAWAITSPASQPASHEIMVTHGGFTLQRFEAWLTTTLQNAILRDPEGSG